MPETIARGVAAQAAKEYRKRQDSEYTLPHGVIYQEICCE
jgi:hypothetical protein